MKTYRLKHGMDVMSKSIRRHGYKEALGSFLDPCSIAFCGVMRRFMLGKEEVELTEAQILFVLQVMRDASKYLETVRPERWWDMVKRPLETYGMIEEVLNVQAVRQARVGG